MMQEIIKNIVEMHAYKTSFSVWKNIFVELQSVRQSVLMDMCHHREKRALEYIHFFCNFLVFGKSFSVEPEEKVW